MKALEPALVLWLAMKSKAEVGASVGPLVDDSVGSEVIGTELEL